MAKVSFSDVQEISKRAASALNPSVTGSQKGLFLQDDTRVGGAVTAFARDGKAILFLGQFPNDKMADAAYRDLLADNSFPCEREACIRQGGHTASCVLAQS